MEGVVSFVRSGVILVFYVFLVIVIYIFVSPVFENIVSGLGGISLGSGVDPHVSQTISAVRIVFSMVIGGLGLVPLVWFVGRVFQREPHWSYYSR